MDRPTLRPRHGCLRKCSRYNDETMKKSATKTIPHQLVAWILVPLLALTIACSTVPVPAPPPPSTAPPPFTAPPPSTAPADEPAPPPEAPPAESGDQTGVDPAVVSAPLDARLPLTPEVRTGQLDNGLRYFIRHHTRPENRAELRLLVNAGSILEDEDQQGLAHFLEHMAFNGTEHFAKNELVDYLEKIGMRFGADLNAYTHFDETVYMLTVPTDDPQLLATGFEILEDWAHRITIEPEEVDKERGVVIEEWRLGRGAGARVRDEQFPILFQGSRYAERLPIGQKEILETAPAEALRRFYEDWYRPDLMAVVAVGDFDVDVIEARIREHFAALEGPETPRERSTWDVPDHDETLWSVKTDPEITRTSLSIYYKLDQEEGGDTYADYRRSLVEGIYHALLNSRLYEIGQRPDPPFLFASAGTTGMVRARAVYLQTAAVRDGEVERGLEALLKEVERVDRHGFQQSELDRIQKDILRGYEQAWRERDKAHSSGLAGELARHFLSDEPAPGIALELELARRFVPTITLEEVNELAERWIREENRVILISAPEKEDVALPEKDALLAVYKSVGESEIEPWVDRVVDAPLLAEIPTGSPVVEQGEIAEIGVTEWRLANGVRVLLKPTDFRNDQILLTGWSPGGHSLVSDQDFTSASFATTLVGQSGLGRFPQIELDKALAGKLAGLSAYIGELEEGVSGYASPEDVEIMFQLLYLTFTQPRLDLDAYQSLRSKLESVIANRLVHPGTVFRDEVNAARAQGHFRRRPMSEEILSELDPQRSLEIYRERFADASDFTFILVGNLDLETLRPLVETYVGGLPTTPHDEARHGETWRDVGVRPPDEPVRVIVEKGIEPKSQVRLHMTGSATYSREEQYLLSSLAQALTIRLREVLREDLGGTYGVGVSAGISERPIEQYDVNVAFGCSPQEAEHLIDTVFDELGKVRRDGIDESYVAKVREAQRRKREIDVKENGFWLGVLKNYEVLGNDPRDILDYESLVSSLTTERLAEIAKRYLGGESYVLGVLYPEGGAEESTVAKNNS